MPVELPELVRRRLAELGSLRDEINCGAATRPLLRSVTARLEPGVYDLLDSAMKLAMTRMVREEMDWLERLVEEHV